MSLLLKALKQAEQAPGRTAPGGTDLDLEPMAETPFSVRREWVQPHGSAAEPVIQPGGPRRGLNLPQLGLVPATAIVALIIALAYGIYVYLAISQPALLAPAVAPHRTTPGKAATEPAQPLQTAPSPPATSLPAPPAIRSASAIPAHEPDSAGKDAAPVVIPARASAAANQSGSTEPSRQTTIQTGSSQADLDAAYQAYQAGHLDEARNLYNRITDRDRNPDALLGLAAIAMLQGRQPEAIRLYQRVIGIDPRNAVAQAALIDALGTTDSSAAESRLKTQIEQSPSAYLYYALGNLYADQKRWSDAETAYFEAFKREPANGDYAFNLAASLDHLQQHDAALRHYEDALKLVGPDTRFNRAQVEERIRQLKEH